ncbi:MAG: hypothetical protein J6R22_02345 [Alphaproteobacteria bacterium]|nr:hypothetical protein [Alphaproteobacteria bacterium]
MFTKCKYTNTIINPLFARPNFACPCYNCKRPECVKEECAVWNYQQNYVYQTAVCNACLRGIKKR